MGLSASTISSRLNAGLQSAQDLISDLTSLFCVRPTLICNVLLEGREMTLKGPLKLGSRPLVSCCLTYTWVMSSPGGSTSFWLILDVGTELLSFLI